MPGFNRQGPMGNGPLSGRGMGMCGGGRGFAGSGRGIGRGLGFRSFQNTEPDIEKEELKNEVAELKAMVSELSKKLESDDKI